MQRDKELAELCKENCRFADRLEAALESVQKEQQRAIKALDMLHGVISTGEAGMKDLVAANKALSDHVDLLNKMIDVKTQDAELLRKELALAKEGKFL